MLKFRREGRVTPLPLFFWVNMLAFGLFLMGKMFSDRPWHVVLQWLGALALVCGIVLLITSRK
jgi:hypothetical protein